ncbi:uncharacterized protein C1orf226 homolog [Emydura macquarii macquarii]|uniref:uncharacterized protein C1orf226 homolog n=1 Tax=Emydura macquarii macquarii TaxID=1129001 RepID=UPI00352A87BD
MFENSNTAPTPTLQPSRPLSRASQGTSRAAPSPAAEPGLRAGSSQHLKNLSKAVGAKVNDFLRRKELAGLGEVGVTEVNASVGAELPGGTHTLQGDLAHGARPVLLEAFPRLEPPPPAAKKRTPRALKTPLDMLISSQPAVSSPECSTECPCPAALAERWQVAWDGSQPEGRAQLGAPGIAGQNGQGPACGRALSAPDLIHEENLEGKLRAADRRATSPPCLKPNLRLSLAPASFLLEGQPSEGDSQPAAQPPSLENGGPHPDLLSFE